jgi:hypothetical protein
MIGGEFPIPLFVGRRTNRPVHVTVACLSRTIAKLRGGWPPWHARCPGASAGLSPVGALYLWATAL